MCKGGDCLVSPHRPDSGFDYPPREDDEKAARCCTRSAKARRQKLLGPALPGAEMVLRP